MQSRLVDGEDAEVGIYTTDARALKALQKPAQIKGLRVAVTFAKVGGRGFESLLPLPLILAPAPFRFVPRSL
jgi:hypothetical protein